MAAAAPVVLFLALRALTRRMARMVVLPSWGFEAVEAPGALRRADVAYYSQALERLRSRPLPRRLTWWTRDIIHYPATPTP